MKYKIIGILILLLSFSIGIVQGFDVPAPPDSQPDGTKALVFGGRDLTASGYHSQANELAIVDFYKTHFMQEGFELVIDKYLANTSNRQLRFKKGPQEVDIFVVPVEDGTKVGILPHYQGPGVRPFDQTLPSFKDTIFQQPQSEMPTEDVPGESIPLVPRLPDSVRIKSQVLKNGAIMAFYAVPMKVKDVVSFYRDMMPNYNWELVKETSMADAQQQFGQISALMAKIPNVFQDGTPLGEVIGGSSTMRFRGQWGSVTITIFTNFINSEEGSMVQVVYRER